MSQERADVRAFLGVGATGLGFDHWAQIREINADEVAIDFEDLFEIFLNCVDELKGFEFSHEKGLVGFYKL